LAIGADLHLIRGWRRHCRWRITPTLRYEAAVAYSGIGHDGIAGARGDFSGQRWLVSTGLIGICKKGGRAVQLIAVSNPMRWPATVVAGRN
jgi:hypothetical protein